MELVLALGLVVALYTLYYVFFVGKMPEVYHNPREDSLGARMVRDLPILQEKFWPTFGLDNKHFQTLLGTILHCGAALSES